MAGEIESKKGHICIPIEVRTQKARLECVTAGSKEEQTDSRAGSSGTVLQDNLIFQEFRYFLPLNLIS